MTAADMIAIYNALKGALSIAVFRAWPQIPSPLPGCAFSLRSWDRLEDGSARTDILVSFRANSPEANDGYTAAARTALQPLGYALTHAEDGVEYDTGFFLRDLVFSALADVPVVPDPPIPPEVQYPLLFRVRSADDTAWLALPSPLDFSFAPAVRQALVTQPLSVSSLLLPALDAGPLAPGSVTVSAAFVYQDPAGDRLQQLFHSRTDAPFTISYKSPYHYRASGILTAFHRSPLGLRFTIAFRGEFTRV